MERLWGIIPSFPGLSPTRGQIIRVLLSSAPRAYPSRLAWLKRTPIAVPAGRINRISHSIEILAPGVAPGRPGWFVQSPAASGPLAPEHVGCRFSPSATRGRSASPRRGSCRSTPPRAICGAPWIRRITDPRRNVGRPPPRPPVRGGGEGEARKNGDPI